MDDLSISQELTRVGLDHPPDYWENVFQEELGVTTLKGLSLVGGDAYPILVKHVNHAWEKKKLQKLLDLENEHEVLSFKTQHLKQINKLKVRYAEVRRIQQEFISLQRKKRFLDHQNKEAAQLAKDAREALQISPSTWKSEYESYDVLIKKTQSLLDRVKVLLAQIDHDDKSVLLNASNGRALQGILLSKSLEDQVADRAKLLKVPDGVQLMGATHQQHTMIQQFTNEKDEENCLKAMHVLGYSAVVPSQLAQSGYWAVCVDTSLAAFSHASNTVPSTRHQPENPYFSTVKYSSIPLASFEFSNKDLQLSEDALKDLQNIESVLISNGLESVMFHKTCEEFFHKYGSHATKGPLHFGGSYTLKCSTRAFTHPELLTLKPLQMELVNMQFGVSCVIGPNKGSYSQVDITRVKTKYVQGCSKTNQTFMEIKLQGGPMDYSTMPEWKAGLVASNCTWTLCDRGMILVPVWDIIEMNHSKQFTQVGKLVGALRKSWEKLTHFTFKPSANFEQTNVLEAVSSWRGNEDSSQVQKQLQFLIDVKQDLIIATINPVAWPMLYLSQASIQRFLKSVVDHQLAVFSKMPSNDESDVKNLVKQLVQKFDLYALKDMDFPESITHWLYNDHEPQQKVLRMDRSAFLNFGRFLNQTLESMKDSSPKPTQSNATDKPVRSSVLTSAISKAFNLFLKILQECGQTYENLFIATLLFPFKCGASYHPVVLSPLSQSELKYLCEIFEPNCEQFFSHHHTPAKTQAFLFYLSVDLYVNQSEIDVYAHQVIRHLQYLQVEFGKGLDSQLSDILNKFLPDSPVNWDGLKLQLSNNLLFSGMLPELGEGGSSSLDNVLEVVSDTEEDQATSIKADQLEEVSEEDDSIDKLKLSSKRGIAELFEKLGLSKYYPQKLSLRDALLIRKEVLESEKCTDPTKLYIYLLQKIMSYDYECRVNLLKKPDSEKLKTESCSQPTVSQNAEDSDGFDDSDSDEDEDPADSFVIHPMDSLLSLIHCADDFLRQDLMARLVDCQLSIPLVLPDPFNENTVTLCMWTMKTIVKEWKSTSKDSKVEIHECPLISYPTPVVTFIRFGKQERSKSKLLNDVVSDSNHDHFFHHDCEGGTFERYLVDGLVEMCWYLPAGKPKDIFPDMITFLNLHGNAAEHPKQINFLSKVSFTTFVLITEDDLKKDEESVTEVLKKLSSSAPGGVVLCTTSKPSKFKHLTEHIPDKLACLKLMSKNADEIKKEVREKIKKKLEKVSTTDSCTSTSLQECTEVAKECGITVDETKEDIVCSQKKAQSLVDMLKKHDDKEQSAKGKMLPLQGATLWKKWATLDKEEHRQLNRGGMRIEEYSSHKQREKNGIRNLQQEYVQHKLSPFMKSFTETLLTTSGSSRQYYLEYLKLYLNSLSRQTISSRKHEYKAKRNKLLEFQKSENPNKIAEQDCRKQMERLQQEIIDASLGLEHLLRELGQVYEAVQHTHHMQAGSTLAKKYARLPRAGAELLIGGYPLELMDGDAAHVPKQWVTAVLEEVKELLKNPRVFVLSVLGLQSTGKSTLINTTFGLQFNVGAGRCTRGAFMQLLPISDELRHETNCDYVLVVDTEGLRAPELDAQKTQKHDNELATFVIGIANETMINIYGETPGDMDDILQTSVHAFLRMKSVRLSPSCQFVHQNVGAVAAGDKGGMGRARFKDKLDKMTAEAAKEEEHEGLFQYFSDVIRFNEEQDVHYFPGLWKGDPPMAPVNPGYSEKATSLKLHLVKRLTPTTCKTLSVINLQIKDLWNALLHEKFVFSFKNTLEISVYTSLEAKYVQWSWSFRSSMLQWEEDAKIRIKNSMLKWEENAENSQQDGHDQLKDELLNEDLPNTVEKVHVQLQKEMRLFFEESEQRDMLAQWQTETESRLKRLATELKQHAEGFCQELTTSNEALKRFKSKNTEYQDELKKKVKTLISTMSQDQLKAGKLTAVEQKIEERKLRKMFDEQWEEWIKELRKEAKVHRVKTDVEKNVQDSLTEFFKTEEGIVLTQLRAKPFKDWGKTLKLELREEHVYLKVNIAARAWNAMTAVGSTVKKGFKKAVGAGKEEPEPEPTVLSHRQHRECLQATTDYAFGQVRVYLKSRENENFNPTYTHELLDKLTEAIQKRSTDHPQLIVTREYTIDMSITACAYAARQFQTMVDKFHRQNDPIEQMNGTMKEPLYNIFESQYFQAADEKAAASTFCRLLKEPVLQNIRESLATAIFQDMKILPWATTKTSLKATVLISLGEKLSTSPPNSRDENITYYWSYLTNANDSLQWWIRHYTDEHCEKEYEDGLSKLAYLACKKADVLVAGVRKAVNEVTKATDSEQEINPSKWLKDVCEKLTGTLVVSGFGGFQDLGISRSLKDIPYFKEEVKQRLESLRKELRQELQHLTIQELNKKPYDLLYSQLCGCEEQCPFCKEQCDATIKDHLRSDVKHTCEAHRPDCLGGCRWLTTQEMDPDVCTSLVGSDYCFSCKETDHKQKPYKEFQQVHACIP